MICDLCGSEFKGEHYYVEAVFRIPEDADCSSYRTASRETKGFCARCYMKIVKRVCE